MRLLALFLLALSAEAATIVQTGIRLSGVVFDPCSNAVQCHSQLDTFPYHGMAGAGVDNSPSSDGISLFVSMFVNSNSIMVTSTASVAFDEMVTFGGGLLVEAPGNPNPLFATVHIVVDAPLFTGELPAKYQDQEWGRAWSIQPGVPVHIIMQGTLHESEGGTNISFGLFDPIVSGGSVPEPSTWALMGLAALVLSVRRYCVITS